MFMELPYLASVEPSRHEGLTESVHRLENILINSIKIPPTEKERVYALLELPLEFLIILEVGNRIRFSLKGEES